jgi:leucyl-tRNA synthetase
VPRFSPHLLMASASASSSAASTAAGAEPKSFARRDHLLEVAARWQARWQEARVFESEAAEPTSAPAGKFFCTFPYPYMNGRLHLGHGFSMSKAEFASRFHRLLGQNTLFPFAFHCTGMPIQAAANKLKRELSEPDPEEEAAVEEALEAAAASTSSSHVATPVPDAERKFTSKKTKVAAKGGKGTSQAEILAKVGVPEGEIPHFVDPVHWLRYFPPFGQKDLEEFGMSVDWRRSFITTDVNPFYDSFIRWQFRNLKEQGKIKYGKRPTVFSPRDGQACADHDRASGEGVCPQEYTLIKMQVLPGPDGTLPGKLAEVAVHPSTGAPRPVFLVAATLRPETMYGQTNCFVLPDGEYGVFEVSAEGSEVFVCSHRSALNMSYQGLSPAPGAPKCVADVTGRDLLGLAVAAPNAVYEHVFVLPLLTISMGKGTGVVTSVPSDAPDDFAALMDLKRKPAFREKFGITAEMVEPFDLVEIIDIPGLGRRAAEAMCEQLGIKSQNDKDKLAKAKERTYLEGFYKGVMLVGSQAGKRVEEAKPLVREEMIREGKACPYYEPEKLVISRSGDECVVAQLDQWYLEYGEEAWRKTVEDWVEGGVFTSYNPLAQDQYRLVLAWLKEWACSRSFGLGTRVPWDEKFVIESLSDSTIYMAYYTVVHLLQGKDNLDGTKIGPLGIKPEDMTDAAWDYVFKGAAYSTDCSVPEDVLAKLRKEFEYWYPMDLRVSGKDLIGNHLTMSLYNHAAIWGGRADRMPQSFYTNGHVCVDNEKMSKSLGNFLTLKEATDRFSPDGVRFALADAGDGMEDANFDRRNADNAILRLYVEEMTLKAWSALLRGDESLAKELVKESSDLDLPTFRQGSPLVFMDRYFLARMHECVHIAKEAYSSMRFRDALKYSFFELQIARDQYRENCKKLGIGMDADVISDFIKIQAITMAPICPHWAEEIWEAAGGSFSVTTAPWPAVPEPDQKVLSSGAWLTGLTHSIRVACATAAKKASKKGTAAPAEFNAVTVYTQATYHDWQLAALEALRGSYDQATGFPADVLKAVQAAVVSKGLKAKMKDAMAFASGLIKEERPYLGSTPKLNDAEAIRENLDFLLTSSEMKDITLALPDSAPEEDSVKAHKAVPGFPVIIPRTLE